MADKSIRKLCNDNEPEIVNESVIVTNKTGVLGELTHIDYGIINSPSGWLDCNIT